jgi:hypothetical protein
MTDCYSVILDRLDTAGCDLSGVTFRDTGGTNGWLAETLPPWVEPFLKSLPLQGHITQVVLRKLPAGLGIPPHIDPVRNGHPRVIEHRYHVPLVTHEAVTMRWPDEGTEVHLAAGCLYEVNHNQKVHEVIQHAPVDRVHLCIDTSEVLTKGIFQLCS